MAEEANVSRSTVLSYFPSKRGLLRGIAIEELGKLQQVAEGERAGVQGPVAKTRLVRRRLVADTTPYLNVTRYVIVSSMLDPCPRCQRRLALGGILHRLVVEAQEQGEMRPKLHRVDVVHAITGAYVAVFFEQASHSRMAPWGDALDVARIVDLLFEGIAGPRYTAPRPRE